MAEIYEFPRVKYDSSRPVTKEELSENIENFRMGYIDDISEFLLQIVVSEIVRAGFSLNDDDSNDIILIQESLRSLMMRKSGFEHELQKVSDSIIINDDNEDSQESE